MEIRTCNNYYHLLNYARCCALYNVLPYDQLTSAQRETERLTKTKLTSFLRQN